MTETSPFIWHELVTPDQKKSGTFFTQLFGWTRKEVDAGKFGTYTLFQKNGQDVAGMMNPTPEIPSNESFWHSYIAVENVDECAQRAPLLGGSVHSATSRCSRRWPYLHCGRPYRCQCAFNAANQTVTYNLTLKRDAAEARRPLASR